MYRLPDALRTIFQEPFGPVYSTEELKMQISRADPLVCIGDQVSLTALELGLKPQLVIVDFKTQRNQPLEEKEVAVLRKYGRSVVRVANPPATVTAELYAAVVQGLRLSGGTRIEVEGEEDLAGLPVFAEAPDGTTVLYGMPKRGVCLVRVDAAIRQTSRHLLHQMKV